MNIRGLGDKIYNTSEYTKLEIYFPSNNSIALIKRELYIINNLLVYYLLGSIFLSLRE